MPLIFYGFCVYFVEQYVGSRSTDWAIKGSFWLSKEKAEASKRRWETKEPDQKFRVTEFIRNKVIV